MAKTALFIRVKGEWLFYKFTTDTIEVATFLSTENPELYCALDLPA